MPCYEVNTISVEFKAAHKPVLLAALKALKWRYEEVGDTINVAGMTLDLKAGKAELRPSAQYRLNQLKVAYSQQAIAALSAKNRWANSKQTATKGALLKATNGRRY